MTISLSYESLSWPRDTKVIRELAAAMQRADAAVARSTRALSAVTPRPEGSRLPGAGVHPEAGRHPDARPVARPTPRRNPLVYDPDWDEAAELTQWRRVVAATENLPPTLHTVIALDAWDTIEPLQRQPWIGQLIGADLLRQRGTMAVLPGLSFGLKQIPRERRRSKDQATRLVAGLDALATMARAGLKDHDRWLTARHVLTVKLKERRATSHLPDLIDLVMRCPLVTTGFIARDLRISLRSAQALIIELGLRELTGRGRYRAWGIL